MLLKPENYNQQNCAWEINWYRKHEILLVRMSGYFTEVSLKTLADQLQSQLDRAVGERKIFVVVDQSELLGISPLAYTAAALHPVFTHPRGARMIVVGASRPLQALNMSVNRLVRFAESVREAVRDIDTQRAKFFVRLVRPLA